MKLPYYVVNRKVRSGTHGTTEDKSHLVTFPEAVKLLTTEKQWAGIGVCALKQNDVFFIDLDNCIDQATGEISPLASELLQWQTYTEISPSGKGLRMVLEGNPGINSKNVPHGIELFSTKGFVTLTGTPFGKTVRRVKPATTRQVARLQELLGVTTKPDTTDSTTDTSSDDALLTLPSPLTKERYRDVKQALKHIDPDCSYNDWLLVAQALHSGDPRPDGKGFEAWLRWSQKGGKYEDTSEEAMARKWRSFHAGGGVTLSSLFRLAQQGGFTSKVESEPIPDDTDDDAYSGDNIPDVETVPLADGLFDNYGAYVFIGRAKIGKSRILGALVGAALCAGNALGFKFKKRCQVLALTLEEDAKVLADRMRTYSVEPIEFGKKLRILDAHKAIKASHKFSEEHDWTAWLDMLLRKYKPDIAYIDTAIKMRMLWQNDPSYRSHNVTEQDYHNASWLDQAAQKHKCVIISVIHGSKRKGAPQHNFDPFESIGTTSWTLAGCTGALVLTDKPGFSALDEQDDGQRVFSVRGRYMPRGDGHYTLQSNPSGTFTNIGEFHAVEATKRQSEYLGIAWGLIQSGLDFVTARQIAAEAGKHERTVKALLKRFMDSGELFNDCRLEGVQGSGYRFVAAVSRKKSNSAELDEILS